MSIEAGLGIETEGPSKGDARVVSIAGRASAGAGGVDVVVRR